jgi:hypothetical protein
MLTALSGFSGLGMIIGFYLKSICEGSMLRALASLRMVRGIGLFLPVSMRLIVAAAIPVNSASSLCESVALSLNSFKLAMMAE